MNETVNVINPDDGQTYAVPADMLPKLQAQGVQVETPSMMQARVDERDFGNRPVSAGLAGAARGATFGLSDYLASKLGYGESLAKLKAKNEAASVVGELGGAVGSALLIPGGGLVGGAARAGKAVETGLAAKAGASAATTLAERVVSRYAPQAVGSAVEGLFYGAGQTLSEHALGDPHANAEMLLSNMGLSAILGGGLSLAGNMATEGIRAGVKLVPGHDGSLAGPNRAYAKLASFFGADEDAYRKILENPAKRKAALELTSDEALQRVAETARVVVPNGQAAASDAYESLFKAGLSDASATAVVQGDANRLASRVITDGMQVAREFGHEFADNQSFYRSGLIGSVLENTEKSLKGLSPELKAAWQGLREDVAKMAPTEKAAQMILKGEGSIGQIPKWATEDQKRFFVELHLENLVKAKQQVQEALPSGPNALKLQGLARDEKFLLDLKDRLAAIPANIPDDIGGAGFGKALGELNGVYSSFKQDFEKLDKELLTSGEFNIQKALNFVKAGGAKGSRVDAMIERAENFIDRYRAVAGRTEDGPAKLQALEESFAGLKQLREDGTNLRIIDTLKYNMGPSGSGATLGALALGGAGYFGSGGDLSTAAGMAAIPALNPHYFIKALDSLEKVLHKDVSFSKLKTLEDLVGSQVKTVGDVAATSIKALTSAVRVPALVVANEATSKLFSERRDLIERAGQSDPTKVYEATHKLFGNDAPANAMQVGTLSLNALQYLQGKLPPVATVPIAAQAFDKSPQALPSSTEMARFNRAYEAIENPLSVLSGLGSGTLTTEHVEAIKAVYPQLYASVGYALTTHFANQPTSASYRAKLALGVWFGTPTMPAMQPAHMAQLQQIGMGAQAQSDAQNAAAIAPSANGVSEINTGKRLMTPTQASLVQ